MKLITRDTDYAVRALCFIARRKKEIVSVSELVATLRIPRPFLRKILQILNQKKMLKSYKGKGGGFNLAQNPANIFLLDLINIFQGSLKINECLFKKAPCPNIKTCKLKKKLDRIQKYVIAVLKNISLASLLKKGKTNG
ncbi:MAG: Rrf2 family transcriptional regulator [Candidatus Omnitrophica bacterium]|nr:Rrf2 family transcriptional regulator [Candidatus Omnitrophota bacterium]